MLTPAQRAAGSIWAALSLAILPGCLDSAPAGDSEDSSGAAGSGAVAAVAAPLTSLSQSTSAVSALSTASVAEPAPSAVQPSSAVDPLPDTTATQPDSADAVLSFSPAIVISDTISLQPPPRLAGLVTASDVVKDPLSPFPQLELPDIQLDGSMRVRAPYPADGPTQVVNIYVHNVGRADATEPFITIYVGDELAVRGALMNFNTNPDLNTLKPGEGGVVYAEFPVGVLQECNSVALAIEMHAVSAYRPATIAAYCPLRWSTPITAQRLGYEPNPRIAGTTLDDIVNNRVSVRPNDEYRCWSCHFTGSPHPYAPDPLLSITLTAEINGKFWGGQVQSWAYSLAQQSDQYKAPYIKALFTKWLADGSLP